MDFYSDLLTRLVAQGRLDPAARTLVVAGDEVDREALRAAGFTNATISNLEGDAASLAPYEWARLDAEALDLADDSYAQVIDHMGLHHCASPHRALLEMYRVAASAVLVIENRDSLLTRLATRLGLARDYEFEAVRDAGYSGGGARNSAVPNHVYRWTEREVAKTIASADPAHAVDITYFCDLRFPEERIGEARGLKRLAFAAARGPVRLLARAFPAQANVFAFLVDKGGRRLRPWMESADRMKQGGEPA
jgi:SAM-dependent methyltransferase